MSAFRPVTEVTAPPRPTDVSPADAASSLPTSRRPRTSASAASRPAREPSTAGPREARRRRARRAATPRPGGLPELVFAGPHRYRLVRAWPRGRDHALLELADDDGTPVAAQWFRDPEALAATAQKAPEPARVAGDVLLQPGGADARLRALPAVLAEDDAQLVAHRPGRRAVVRLSEADGTAREYVKVVRPSRAEDLARRGALVSKLIGEEVPVPRLVDASEPARGVLRWSVVPGATLHDLGAAGAWSADQARAAWTAAGRAVAQLHAAPTAAVTERHGPQRELDAMVDWLDPAVAHGLLDAELVARAGERVAAELETGADGSALGVLHRDLHDKQLLIDDEGSVGMIDVDTLAVGERALDVANLLVHLELRQAQGLLAPELGAAAREGFLAGLAAPDLLAHRVAAYARATRLRLAAVYAFRPRWRTVAAELLRNAAGR